MMNLYQRILKIISVSQSSFFKNEDSRCVVDEGGGNRWLTVGAAFKLLVFVGRVGRCVAYLNHGFTGRVQVAVQVAKRVAVTGMILIQSWTSIADALCVAQPVKLLRAITIRCPRLPPLHLIRMIPCFVERHNPADR